MKVLAYNSVPICLLILAAFLAHHDKKGWGWCIVGAIVLTVIPKHDNE